MLSPMAIEQIMSLLRAGRKGVPERKTERLVLAATICMDATFRITSLVHVITIVGSGGCWWVLVLNLVVDSGGFWWVGGVWSVLAGGSEKDGIERKQGMCDGDGCV